MTDPNRGAYTPQSEAPLAFDARRASAPGARPMPVTLIISAVILAVLVIGAFILYKNGPRKPDMPPLPVGEPVAPTTGPTPTEANPVDAPPGLQIYADGQPVSGTPKLAPGPEQPVVRPAPTEAPALRPTLPTVAPAPVGPASAAKSEPLPSAPKAAPAPKAAALPKEAAPPAVAKATPAPTAPAVAAAKVPPPTSAAAVQIGAFSSTALADAGWNKLARDLPGDMLGKTKQVEKVDRDGTTLYRALVGGFASRADAVTFCDTLRAKGEACTVR